MSYLSTIHSVLPTVDGGWRTPSLEKQIGVPARKLSNVLLWTGPAAKRILATLKKAHLKKKKVYFMNIFTVYLDIRQPFPLALHFLSRRTSILPSMLRTALCH